MLKMPLRILSHELTQTVFHLLKLSDQEIDTSPSHHKSVYQRDASRMAFRRLVEYLKLMQLIR